MTDRIVPLKDTAQNTSLPRHLTLHGTVQRHRQPKMLFYPRWASLDPQMGSGAHQSTQKIETCHQGPTFVVFRVQKIVEKTVLNEV